MAVARVKNRCIFTKIPVGYSCRENSIALKGNAAIALPFYFFIKYNANDDFGRCPKNIN